MYQIGELVQYGNSGVCKIEEIVQGVPGLQKDTQCYLLVPVGRREEKIYSPVENGRVKMRRILSSEEVKELMGKLRKSKRLLSQMKSSARAFTVKNCTPWIVIVGFLY